MNTSKTASRTWRCCGGPHDEATHDVFNQSTPWSGVNLFDDQPAAAGRAALPCARVWTRARCTALGELAGSAEMQSHARLANTHRPRAAGRTIEPAGASTRSSSIPATTHSWAPRSATACTAPRGDSGAGAHLQRAAAFMLFTELEPSVLCPVSMTYAVTPALRANPALHAAWGEGLAATAVRPALRAGDAEDGADDGHGHDREAGRLRRARQHHPRRGRRRPMPGASDTCSPATSGSSRRRCATPSWCWRRAPAGLSCFFVPRWRPDGSVNPIRIQRLKDKLGNHANASSEVEFDGDTQAWLVGDEGRGVPQILEMGAMTRLDCALGTAGLMRQALTLAIHHTPRAHGLRQASGRAAADEERARRPGAGERGRHGPGAAPGRRPSTPANTPPTRMNT